MTIPIDGLDVWSVENGKDWGDDILNIVVAKRPWRGEISCRGEVTKGETTRFWAKCPGF